MDSESMQYEKPPAMGQFSKGGYIPGEPARITLPADTLIIKADGTVTRLGDAKE